MMRSWWVTAGLVAWAIAATACRSDLARPEVERDPSARRNIDELQRLVQSPRACDELGDCPIGKP